MKENNKLVINILKNKEINRNYFEKMVLVKELQKIVLFKEQYEYLRNKNKNTIYDSFNNFLFKLSEFLKLKIVKKGKFLFKINDNADKMYIVLSGKCSLFLPKNIKIFSNKKGYFEIKNKILNDKNYSNLSYEQIQKNKFNFINEELWFIYNQNTNKLDNFLLIYNLFKEELITKEEILFLNNYENLDNLFKNEEFKYHEKLKFFKSSSFGDLFLDQNENCKRSGFILCLKECYFAELNKKDYNIFFKTSKNIEISNHFKEIFTEIDKNIIKQIIVNLEHYMYKKDKILFSQNKPIKHIYFIAEGEVKITINLKNIKYNQTLCILKSNEFLSEDDAINNKGFHKYSAIINTNNTRIYFWEINKFKEHYNKYIPISNYFNNTVKIKIENRQKLLKNKFKIQKFYNSVKPTKNINEITKYKISEGLKLKKFEIKEMFGISKYQIKLKLENNYIKNLDKEKIEENKPKIIHTPRKTVKLINKKTKKINSSIKNLKNKIYQLKTDASSQFKTKLVKKKNNTFKLKNNEAKKYFSNINTKSLNLKFKSFENFKIIHNFN